MSSSATLHTCVLDLLGHERPQAYTVTKETI
jgi:hypothetical protein